MRVKDLLCNGVSFVDLKPLEAKNLKGICKLGLHVSLLRMYDGDIPYCNITSPCNGIDKVFHHICIFPVRDSMDICSVVNRAITIIDYLGYLKHVKI